MQPIDTQQEFTRLSQLYRDMRDEELENVAAEACDLTDIACEALRFEISSRGLKIALNLTPPPEEDAELLPPTDDGFIPPADELATVERAGDLAELQKIKAILDQAQIECFLGEEKVHDPRDLTSGFDGGVMMRVWRPAYEKAYAVLRVNIPGYGGKVDGEIPDTEVRCPKCHSDGVIFEELEGDLKSPRNSNFHWRCDDCGYAWEDDGIVS
jgi:hypothetical protein